MIYTEVPDVTKYSFDKEIYYNSANHIYSHKGRKFTSVTKILSDIKPPFVATKYMTYKTQMELLMTHNEVLAYWGDKNRISKLRGSFIHFLIEKMLVESLSVSQMQEIFVLDQECVSILQHVANQKFKDYHVEFIVYNVALQLAGQIDLLVMHDKKSFSIHDWKTNKKDLNKSFGKFAVTNEAASSMCEYTYQLSIYAYMVEQLLGIKCRGLYVHHFDGTTNKKIKVKYVKRKVKAILKDYDIKRQNKGVKNKS